MSEKASAEGSAGELVLYATEDGQSRLFLRAEGGTVWLNQAELAALFQTTKQNISLHVRNVLSEGELAAAATVKDHLTVRTEGKREVRRKVQLYNLDMILAVGYRVKSPRGTQFRQWATTHLREYLVKGFVMDDERLKNPPVGDKAARDHFDELLDRIRDIRASERRMYLRVREIFAMAADYVPRRRRRVLDQLSQFSDVHGFSGRGIQCVGSSPSTSSPYSSTGRSQPYSGT